MITKFKAHWPGQNVLLGICEVMSIDFYNGSVILTNGIVVRRVALDKVHLMPFIGMVDGEGTEIYKDYVMENTEGHLFVVGFQGMAFNYRGLTLKANGSVDFTFDTITADMKTIPEMKVVGHIWENPEYLDAWKK